MSAASQGLVAGGAFGEACAGHGQSMEYEIPPGKEVKKFVVVSTQRSGSTLLADLIRQHPNISMCEELLIPQARWHAIQAWVARCSPPHTCPVPRGALQWLHARAPPAALREIVGGFYSRSNGPHSAAVGFKIMIDQVPSRLAHTARARAGPGAWPAGRAAGGPGTVGEAESLPGTLSQLEDVIFHDESIAKIFLIRRNAVARAVSLAKIRQARRGEEEGGLNQWVGGSTAGVRVRLSLNDVIKSDVENKALRRMHDAVARRGQAPLLLHYAQLAAGGGERQDAMERVWHHLHVPGSGAAPLRSSVRRQRGEGEGAAASVANWDEIEGEARAWGMDVSLGEMLKYP